MTSLVAALAQLPGVAEAAEVARGRIDELLWDRALPSRGSALRADSILLGARDCAAIDGIDLRAEAWRSGAAFDQSPMGRSAAGVLLLYRSLGGLVGVWKSAPAQALARMHALVTRGVRPGERPGTPRQQDAADDPLRLGSLPPAAAVPGRLADLAELVTAPQPGPALVEAALVHAELLALRPFDSGNGPIARAAARLVLAARGVDPDLLTLPESGIMALGRPAYVGALRAYIRADPAGVAEWVGFHCDAVALGARRARDLLGELG